MSPEISVIIPALDEEECIENLLKSLKNQDCNVKFEIIVADNGSKDDTVKIARKYTDKVVSVKERGTGPARNGGAKHANGKYLIFLDADAVLPLDYLARAHRIFKKDKYAGFCGGFKYQKKSLKFRVSGEIFNLYLLIRSIFGGTVLPGFNICVPKSIFLKTNGFKNLLFEDIYFSCCLKKIGKTKYFNNFYLFHSTRRLEKMGILKALNYYISRDKLHRGAVPFSDGYVKI